MQYRSKFFRSLVRLIQITVNTLSTTAQMTIRVSATSCSSSTLSDIRCAGLLVGSNTHKSAVTPYPDILRVHHPPAPRACEPPSRQRHQRSPRPPRRRLRTRYLLRATRQHFPNPRLRGGTTPVNPPAARPNPTCLTLIQPARHYRERHRNFCSASVVSLGLSSRTQ